MKTKVFEVVLHKLPAGKSSAAVLEEQLNGFLAQHPDIQITATHMNTVVVPAQPDAMPSSAELVVVIFCTVFYAG